MYAFINNIKIQRPEEEKLRYLNDEEKEVVLPLFFRKSKEHFNFEDIAKKIVPKVSAYAYYKSRHKKEGDYLFNFDMRTSVSGCKTISQLKALFGENWKDEIAQNYRLKSKKTGKKSIDEMVSDVWHVLFSFDRTDKLKEFAQSRLGLDEDKAREFSKIKLKQDYAALSLKAINKILPYLKEGLIYPHAVFMAKLEDLIPDDIWNDVGNRQLIQDEIYHFLKTQSHEKQIADIVNGIITINRREGATWSENEHWQKSLRSDIIRKLKKYFGAKSWDTFAEEERENFYSDVYENVKLQMNDNLGRGVYKKTQRVDERIRDFISDHFNIEKEKLEEMYHPSAVEVYKDAPRANDGNYYLGSPLISSIRNPMAMRALHHLRKVVNELIREGIIDSETKVHVEMARDLKNANERKAIQRWQRERQTKIEKYREQLRLDYKAATGKDIEPTDTDVLKYQLWEEQKHTCIYTGDSIGVSEFIGENPKYDIEHTIPRSLSLDNSMENLTLCNSEYNRKVKRNRIPTELPEYEEFLDRLGHWKKNIEEAKEAVQKAIGRSRANSDNKDAKDSAIQQKHYQQMHLNYWRNKYRRFEMKDVPEGFKNSQIVDTGIITKYARLYLKTVFNKVYTVKGKTVADFRKLWGIQNEYEKNERVNHIHHCINAITIACMTKEVYEDLAGAYHDWEEAEQMQSSEMPQVDPPWKNFVTDVKNVESQILVSHYTPDNLPKKAKRQLRERGKKQVNKKGEPIIQQGDAVRGALHKETNYGAIKRPVVNKKGDLEEKLLYVVRKPVDALSASDIKNIVDDSVREIVKKGKEEETEIRKELAKAEKRLKDAEEQEEITNAQIQFDDLKEKLSNLYAIKNKDGSTTPIRKVRCTAPTVTNPLPVKEHRDNSEKEYKRHNYFVNDGNYAMAIYEGFDKKGNIKREFIIVNNLQAGKYFNKKADENPFPDKHPKSEYLLKYLLKTGTVVMFWENTPDEVWAKKCDKVKRLYKIVKMNKDGRITFKFHQEARNDELLKRDYEKEFGEKPPKSLTNGQSYIDFDNPFLKLLLSPSKFDFLVEGYEFKISSTGSIEKI